MTVAVGRYRERLRLLRIDVRVELADEALHLGVRDRRQPERVPAVVPREGEVVRDPDLDVVADAAQGVVLQVDAVVEVVERQPGADGAHLRVALRRLSLDRFALLLREPQLLSVVVVRPDVLDLRLLAVAGRGGGHGARRCGADGHGRDHEREAGDDESGDESSHGLSPLFRLRSAPAIEPESSQTGNACLARAPAKPLERGSPFVGAGHAVLVERLVEHALLDAGLARDLAQRAARGNGLLHERGRRGTFRSNCASGRRRRRNSSAGLGRREIRDQRTRNSRPTRLRAQYFMPCGQ